MKCHKTIHYVTYIHSINMFKRIEKVFGFRFRNSKGPPTHLAQSSLRQSQRVIGCLAVLKKATTNEQFGEKCEIYSQEG